MELVDPLVRDDDPEVRLSALHYLLSCSQDGEAILDQYLGDDDLRVVVSALRCVAQFGSTRHHIQIEGTMVTIFARATDAKEHRVEILVELANALGAMADPKFNPELVALTDDASPVVVGAALVNMGATKDRELVPLLLESLASRNTRKYARQALAAYGSKIVGTVSDYIADDTADIRIRRALPGVLARIPTQSSVDALTNCLSVDDAMLKFRVVKSLNKLNRSYEDLTIPGQQVDAAFVDETRLYYETLQIMSVQRESESDRSADALLRRALTERLDANLETMFRLLGLRYPQQDIYSAYLGVVSTEKDRRASAIEFLDNVIGRNVKKYLLPIIDPVSEGIVIQNGRRLFGVRIDGRTTALKALIEGTDAWLRACAVYCAGHDDDEVLQAAVEQAMLDPDPRVAETAREFAAKTA